MTDNKLKLWWGSGSQPSRKVQMALEEKQIPYESILISFSNREHKTEEFLKRNPRGKVPTIQDGDFNLYESKAIVHYLDEKHPQHPLFPKDVKTRAIVEQRINEVDYLEEVGRELAPFVFGQKKIEDHTETVNATLEKARKELDFWNKVIQPGHFIVGKEITAADLSLYVIVSWWTRFEASFNDFPNLKEWKERIDQRESAKKSFPPHWKDSKPSVSFAGKV